MIKSLDEGLLKGQGPDGKLMVVIQEEYDGWKLHTLLVTLQQLEDISFIDFVSTVEKELRKAWGHIKQFDKRWMGNWYEINILINPNGPLLNGGSDGDNGQTGRKLVMDYTGPRIAIGGGALYGKDLSHIDRLGAYNARRFAIDMVREGAQESLIQICYAPGLDKPLVVDVISDKRPIISPEKFFSFENMRRKICLEDLHHDLKKLGSFYNEEMSSLRQLQILN